MGKETQNDGDACLWRHSVWLAAIDALVLWRITNCGSKENHKFFGALPNCVIQQLWWLKEWGKAWASARSYSNYLPNQWLANVTKQNVRVRICAADKESKTGLMSNMEIWQKRRWRRVIQKKGKKEGRERNKTICF